MLKIFIALHLTI